MVVLESIPMAHTYGTDLGSIPKDTPHGRAKPALRLEERSTRHLSMKRRAFQWNIHQGHRSGCHVQKCETARAHGICHAKMQGLWETRAMSGKAWAACERGSTSLWGKRKHQLSQKLVTGSLIGSSSIKAIRPLGGWAVVWPRYGPRKKQKPRMTSTYLAQVIGLRVESFTKKRGFRGGGPGLAGVGGEFVRDLLI
jgi:hypothetical protein